MENNNFVDMDLILDALPIEDLIPALNKEETEKFIEVDRREHPELRGREYYDLELLAKYVYARRAELEPKLLESLPESYLASADGLRHYFVDENEKIINFRIGKDGECNLKYFMDNYLGFSHYAYNSKLCYFYFVQFSDALNKTSGLDQNSYINTKRELTKEFELLADSLLPLLHKLSIYGKESFFMNTKIDKNRNKDSIMFIFDALHYRNEIHNYINRFGELFESIITLYKQQDDNAKKGFILYFINFYAMNQLDGSFFERWKWYYSEERPYEKLKSISSACKEYFRKHRIKSEVSPYLILPFIYLLDEFIKNNSLLPDINNEHLFNSRDVFLYYLNGGNVKTNKLNLFFWNKLNLSALEQADITRELWDYNALNNKSKSNRKTSINAIKDIPYIHKTKPERIMHNIYAIFSRCIAYYVRSTSSNKTEFLIRAFCDYIPDDFIQGKEFGVYYINDDESETTEPREKFFAEKKYFNEASEEFIHNVDRVYSNNFGDYISRSKSERHYKSNFFWKLSEYSCVIINNANGNDVFKAYQTELETNIENICSQLLSDAPEKSQ